MAKDGLIDDVVSQKALSQVQQLTDEVNKLTLSLEKALALSGGKNPFGNDKDASKLASEIEKLNIAGEKRAEQVGRALILDTKATEITKKRVKLSIEERVELASQNNLLKLNAIATSEKVTATERLIAQQKLASIAATEAGQKYGYESAQFNAAALNSRKLAGELQSLQARSGTMGKGMNNAYLSTFQLTQVMREIPNFAIDARVGFMSLSNNLPMLADGFKQLANSVDATGKKIGNTGALKIMLKSLLSLNTVMIVAVTLMTLFGDKIVDWVGRLFKGKNAIDGLTDSAKAASKALKEQNGTVQQAYTSYIQLGIVLEKARKGTYNSDEAVKLYNETLGIHYGKVDNINQANIAYVRYAKNFLQSVIAQTAAMNEVNRAGEAMANIQALAIENGKLNKDSNGRLSESYKEIYEAAKKNEGLKELFKDLDQATNKIVFEGLFANKSYGKSLREILDMKGGKEFLKNMKDIAEFKQTADSATTSAKALYDKIDPIFTKENQNTKGVVQTAKDIFITREYYDKKRGDMVLDLERLEQKAAKESTDGILNAYKDREDAALTYYMTNALLAASDYDIAISTAKQKKAKDKQEIDAALKHNKELFAKHKISQADLDKSKEQHHIAEMAITENYNSDINQAEDNKNKQIEDGLVKLKNFRLEISTDQYKDEIKKLDISLNEQEKLISQNREKKRNELDALSTEDVLLSVLGYSKDTQAQALNAEYEANKALIDAKIENVNSKLDIVEKGSDEEKQLLIDKSNFERDLAEEDADYQIKLAEYVAEKKKSIQNQLSDELKKLISAAWDSYWKIQANNLEEESDKRTDNFDRQSKENDELYNQKLISEKLYKENKDALDAERKKSDDEITAKEKENERTKFLFEQGAALSKIAINTALAISSPENMIALGAFTPLYLALGATQAGVIIAQTLPAFEKGGEMKHDGLAMVSEKRQEWGINPDGSVFLTPERPSIVQLQKGARIFPDASQMTNEAIMRVSADAAVYNFSTKDMEAAFSREIKGLKAEIRKLQPVKEKNSLMNDINRSNVLRRFKN